MIKFACSKCGRHISVDDKHAGKRGKCPTCGETVVVPGKSAAIEFRCDRCGHKIKVPQRYAGKQGKCPKCKNAVVVPPLKKESAPAAHTTTLTCSMCGQALDVAAGAADAFVECPACGSFLDPSSGQIASAAEDAMPAGAEEDLDEEPAATTRDSVGVNRRLLLILSGVAAIVIVGVIGLIVVLKSLGPQPAEQRDAPRVLRRVADASPRLQPATSAPQVTVPPAPSEAAATVRLRFGPAPGTKRTVRLTNNLTTSAQESGQPQDVTSSESYTFDLEVTPTRTDGFVPIAVVLAAIQIRTGMAGTTMGEYDSTKSQDSADGIGAMYAPFIGKRFTINVSAQGELVDFGLDALFGAAAEDRLQAEDDMIREKSPDRADRVIESTNQRFGSRENRRLAMKKQLEEFPIFSADKVCGLLSELVVALPDQPLREGERWSRPIVIGQVDRRPVMTAMHTLTAFEEGVCTIQTEGRRGLEEGVLVQGTDEFRVSSRLGGSSQATLTVDRRTGWLLSKEQKTNLSGRIETSGTDAPGQDTSMQVALEIMTTVTTID